MVKKRWSVEEEEDLRAGLDKHGAGKWKRIKRDPEFNHVLYARCHIDLKDKWRQIKRLEWKASPVETFVVPLPSLRETLPSTDAVSILFHVLYRMERLFHQQMQDAVLTVTGRSRL